jgi:hypothetical protein
MNERERENVADDYKKSEGDAVRFSTPNTAPTLNAAPRMIIRIFYKKKPPTG